MIYRRGWVPVLWRIELEKRMKAAGIENTRQVADFLCGRDQVVDNTKWMSSHGATFWQRLNRLWFVPLYMLTIPFQWLIRGRMGFETTSKVGMMIQKLTGLM